MNHSPLKFSAFALWEQTDMELPALIARIPAGEPMDIEDYVEMVDLNYLLTKGNSHPLVIRVIGESMMTEIADGDWIVIDQSLQPEVGDIVVAKINGQHTLKRFKKNDCRGRQGLYLVPANGQMATRKLYENDDLQIKGVVTQILKNARSR